MKFILDYIKHRWVLLLLILCIATTSIVSVVYARYVTDLTANPEVTITAQGILDVGVSDNGGGGGISGGDGSYTIANTSATNIVTYIRATVIVNWQDGDGNIWAIPPVEGTDYSISADNCDKLTDGYYYYKGPRDKNEGFGITVTPKSTKDGYTLHVQILAESIQCVPGSAAMDAWGATYNSATNTWTKN